MNIQKHDLLSTTYAKSIFGIINLGSVVKVKNSYYTNISISINLNNGFTSLINSKYEYSNANLSSQIAIENSRYYTDSNENDEKDDFTYPLFVQSGSIYNYPFLLLTATLDIMEQNVIFSRNELLVFGANLLNSNTKLDLTFISNLEVIGTGNDWYSSHYLTNSKYGYWGNAYAGEFTSDKVISGFDTNSFQNIINTIPRNLNGYKVHIVLSSVLDRTALIKNFYNGVLSVYFVGLTQPIIASDNNCELNLVLSTVHTNGLILNNLLNDNQDVTIKINSINNTRFNLSGNNNKVNLNLTTISDSQFNIFTNNSYGNKVFINKWDDALRSLDTNARLYGNWIYVHGKNEKIGLLVNDSDSTLDTTTFITNTIDEIHPKKYRDCTDIGSIIGWPADLPIPRGYYKCDGQTIAVDIHNHLDDFYNGQLAYYLNSNLSRTTMTIPNIPVSLCIAGYSSDPLIVAGTTYTPADATAKMLYIIKYNNNFENIRGEDNVTPPPPETDPLPVNVSVGFVYTINDGYGTTDTIDGTILRRKVYKDYGGTFDRTCTLRIPRKNGDTILGSKYVLSQLIMRCLAHGHWIDPAAATNVLLLLNGTIIDMYRGIIYNCSSIRQKLGITPEEYTTTYTETNAIPINNLNFIDITDEQNDNGCNRWSNIKASASADDAFIYIVLHGVCYSDRGALENNMWYTNNISNTDCQFYGKN